VKYIERNKYVEADDLAKATTRNTPMLTNVFFQVFKDASVKTVLPADVFFSGVQRRLGQNSHARAHGYKYHRSRRLESSDNGIPPPLL
jgi:hypothetical protein